MQGGWRGEGVGGGDGCPRAAQPAAQWGWAIAEPPVLLQEAAGGEVAAHPACRGARGVVAGGVCGSNRYHSKCLVKPGMEFLDACGAHVKSCHVKLSLFHEIF